MTITFDGTLEEFAALFHADLQVDPVLKKEIDARVAQNAAALDVTTAKVADAIRAFTPSTP